MIVIVATIRVQPDKIDTYEAVCRDLLPKIRTQEPGTVFYSFAKSREEPNTYRVIEVYKDPAAQEFHLQTAYLAEAATALAECFAETPTFIVHDSVD